MSGGYEATIAAFDRRMAGYIPPRSAWTPVDEAVYGPPDPFRVPEAEARRLRLAAIRYSFTRHYEQNRFYHRLCSEHGFAPRHLRGPGDLARVPMLPDRLFREYPPGRDFALWLGNLFSGELPRIVVAKADPGPDAVLEAFRRAGLEIAFSSGTSGRLKFVPRDRPTFLALQYTFMKSVVAMLYPHWDRRAHVYLMMPDPRRTALYAGRSCEAFFSAFDQVRVGLDRAVSAGQVRAAMGGGGGVRGMIARSLARRGTRRLVADVTRWLESREKGGEKIALVGPPFVLAAVMDRLQREGRAFAFGERAMIGTGGGWKTHEGRRLPLADFRARVERTLGIPGRLCLDGYGMVESNAFMVHCPEGHYLHVPHSFFEPLVLDNDQRPLPRGEWGRFAFLDASAASFPGFILTGDRARLLERCPACDRPGPVLDPEVRRLDGEEARGCAEEVRRLLAADLGGRRE
ncbi:MAG: hypothetical protein JXO51_01900 [Candidatus Aminicenantes bacterium]|nr:hypothetical protein [Candidatus Aminicenantes bacterium]